MLSDRIVDIGTEILQISHILLGGNAEQVLQRVCEAVCDYLAKLHALFVNITQAMLQAS